MQVDEALAAMMQRKADNVGGEAASAAVDSSELAAEGLGLRTQMQRAVEEERCVSTWLCIAKAGVVCACAAVCFPCLGLRTQMQCGVCFTL